MRGRGKSKWALTETAADIYILKRDTKENICTKKEGN
jgi:hypothetical protein